MLSQAEYKLCSFRGNEPVSAPRLPSFPPGSATQVPTARLASGCGDRWSAFAACAKRRESGYRPTPGRRRNSPLTPFRRPLWKDPPRILRSRVLS